MFVAWPFCCSSWVSFPKGDEQEDRHNVGEEGVEIELGIDEEKKNKMQEKKK
jgi:hypothetical protein